MWGRFLAIQWMTAFMAFAGADRPYTDVPFVPAPERAVQDMLDLAGVHAGDVVVDLGSGDGRIVIAAAKRAGVRAIGVEIDPELVRRSSEAAKQAGVDANATFVAADLFEYNLRQASVVTVFLTPGVNLRLRPKLLAELRPGTRVVSYRFDMGNWTPDKIASVEDGKAYLWVVPAHSPALAAVPAPPDKTFVQLAAPFSYDPAAPLDQHSDPPTILEGCQITTMSYVGARGPVSATVVTPQRKGKYPAVIFVHDSGKRDEFLPEALLLARDAHPAVSLLIDAPPERPLGWRRNFNAMLEGNDREVHVQAVIDIRRGVDLLLARTDIDPERIGYVGHGYGANWGAILASIEPRLRSFALVAGYPSLADLMETDNPELANLRYMLGSEGSAQYVASLAGVDPIRFTPHWAGRPILFQFGRFDSFIPRSVAERLVNSLPRPAKAIYYEAGHSVNDPRAMQDRAAFLRSSWAERGSPCRESSRP